VCSAELPVDKPKIHSKTPIPASAMKFAYVRVGWGPSSQRPSVGKTNRQTDSERVEKLERWGAEK